MTGIVEVGDVEINAARSQALEWDGKAFVEELTDKLRPTIKESLTALSKELSIPAKYGFIVSVAKNYGVDLLFDTELPWISVIEQLGTNNLVTPQGLVDLLTQKKEVAIVYGKNGNPWDSVGALRKCFSEMSNSAVIIPVSNSGQPNIPSKKYIPGEHEEIEWSVLTEVFKANESYYSHYGEYEDAVLLRATLYIVAQSLGRSEKELVEMKWARLNETVSLRIAPA